MIDGGEKEKVKSILGTGRNTLELTEMNETGQNRREFGPRWNGLLLSYWVADWYEIFQ